MSNTPELHPVLLAGLGEMPSQQRHSVILRRLPEIRSYAMRLMESGSIPFPVMLEGEQEVIVDHTFIMAEFSALARAGYDIAGNYLGVMPPHEAADTADSYLRYLRRERAEEPPTS